MLLITDLPLAYTGKMTNVVIQSGYANGKSVISSMGVVANAVWLIPASDDYNNENYVKVVSNFADYNQFKGSFSFNVAYNSLYDSYRSATKTLNFAIGSIWQENNGISLMFLQNV